MAEGWLARELDLTQVAAYNGTPWVSSAQRKAKAAVIGETVTDYATRWIENRNIKPATRQHYTDLLDKHITPTWAISQSAH